MCKRPVKITVQTNSDEFGVKPSVSKEFGWRSSRRGADDSVECFEGNPQVTGAGDLLGAGHALENRRDGLPRRLALGGLIQLLRPL